MDMLEIVLKKNEEKIIPILWFDEPNNEQTIHVSLNGEGASVILVGLFIGTQSNKLTFNTLVSHNAPNTRSLTTLRAVFRDMSSFSNDGLITISSGAKGADGYFASKVLLFDNARGRSVPSLEIDENELKAGHASTVGRPDESQLFYLRSRGLSEKEAISLIVTGFFNPLFQYLSEDEVRAATKRLHAYSNE